MLTNKALRPAIAIGVALTVSWFSPLRAQTESGIRLVVPYAAGGSATTSARLFADKLSAQLGQKVYVDNKGGASGAIGAAMVAKSPADGKTLLYAAANMMTVNPTLFGSQLNYKVDEFEPVSLASTFASVLFVNKDIPANDPKSLIAYAKANPRTVTFGSAGSGSSGHLWGEVLKERGGIDIQHIPYKGTSPALIDVIGGRITFVMDSAAAGREQLKAGNLKALAVTSDSRVQSLPEVPTFAESGIAGFETLSWYGVFAPAGTPENTVNELAKAIAAVAADEEYRQQMIAAGMSAASSTPQALDALIVKDSKLWADVIQKANIVVQ